MPLLVLIRGGGDLASGAALRLQRAGWHVVITELAQPLAVRRLVSFAEAVYAGQATVEEVTARRVNDAADTLRVLQVLAKGQIPVVVDPECSAAQALHPGVIIDARMLKRAPEPLRHSAQLYIGLGPGFIAGQNCHAAIETQRGHTLGRVYWNGGPAPDTGVPETVLEHHHERVLRAPQAGTLTCRAAIGDSVETAQVVAEVDGRPVAAPFAGMLRGLLHDGAQVAQGMKIGDLDPRSDPALCRLVSDKALAVGGGVLEAILARGELRRRLWA